MGVLDGKVAIVTGGARGIGAAVARLYAREGAAVVVNDFGVATDGSGGTGGPAEELVQEIRDAGGQAHADPGDISDTATGERLVAAAVEEFGRLDIVVNAAGIVRDRMIFNMSELEWDSVIRVHLRGHFSTLRPASAYWRQQRDPHAHYRIINFTSISGLEGSPGQANYAAAKMGIIGLTYSAAQGLHRYGVRANAIAPGAATRLLSTVPADKQIGDYVGNDDMSPDNVAWTALYLGSERSEWLSGRVVSAEGYRVGLYANPEIVREVDNRGPWAFDTLANGVEAAFRPIADGLPYSSFTTQS